MQQQFGRGFQKHVLTIALEDYFHAPAFAKVINQKRWGRFESRFEKNCLSVLDKLSSTGSKATFFVNSWVARQRPDLLREVVRQGHEIGLAGQRAKSFRSLTAETLREQVRRDRDVLEHACDRRVIGFRVADILLDESDLWALSVLAQEGFRYDSSLSPFLRSFAKQPWRQYIHENHYDHGSIWEVPLSSEKIAGLMIPVAGGNYFRQLPSWILTRLLTRWDVRRNHPLVLYFRLWDFDPLQPRLVTGSIWRDVRHYRNGERIVVTLDHLLSQFSFASVAGHLNLDVPAAVAQKQIYSEDIITSPQTKKQRKAISIVVPCLNEEQGIPYLVSNLRELKENLSDEFDAEFIIVDDGSTDKTWDLLEQYFLHRSDTQLIRHAKNQGISAAILSGIRHGREIVCSMDCDCSYDPNELKPMLHLMVDGVDLVTASPYHPGGAVINVPPWRLLVSRCASALYRVVTGKKLYTFTSCLRVYKRSVMLDVPLQYPNFLGIAELISHLALQKRNIVEHPATLEARIFGQSKMNVVRNSFGHLRLLSQLAGVRMKRRRTLQRVISARVNPQNSKQTNIVSEVEL